MSATNRGAAYRKGGAYYTRLADARRCLDRVPGPCDGAIVLEPSVGGGAFLRALIEHERSAGHRYHYQAVDLDPNAAGLDLVRARGGWTAAGDFLQLTPPEPPDVVIGNPPFGEPIAPSVCPRCHGLGGEERMNETPGYVRVAMSGIWWRTCKACKGDGEKRARPLAVAPLHIRHALEVVRPGGYVAFLLRLGIIETETRRDLWSEHFRACVALSDRPAFIGNKTDNAAYGLFVWQRGYTGAATFEVL